MSEPDKSPFDGFKTVGETQATTRKQGRLAGFFWMVVAGLVFGGLIGGGVYIGFEFWRGMPPRYQHGLQHRMYVEISKHPLSEEEMDRRILLSTLIGAGLGGTLAMGLALKGAPSRERP